MHKLVPKETWKPRYDFINEWENLLVSEKNTTIFKFFLYISKDEQLARFKERLDDPARQWKISESDYTEGPTRSKRCSWNCPSRRWISTKSGGSITRRRRTARRRKRGRSRAMPPRTEEAAASGELNAAVQPMNGAAHHAIA